MEWLSQNWIWLLFFAGFIAMHMFGHGGHGGHGKGRKVADDGVAATPEDSPRHRH